MLVDKSVLEKGVKCYVSLHNNCASLRQFVINLAPLSNKKCGTTLLSFVLKCTTLSNK